VNPGRCQLRFARLRPLFVLALFVFPASAHAHTKIKGMGEFVSGLAHPLTTPAHVLILLALGLMLGQHTPIKLKMPVLVFVPLSAVALFLTTTRFAATVPQPILICFALCAAILVALEKAIPPVAVGVLLAAAALAIGFDSAVENGTTAVVIKTLLGIWVALVAVLFDLAFYVSRCTEKKWMKVAIRVIGSWIIAISLLVLAFSLRK
jgi:hydrogenase/urease accessory protein HupE